MTTVAMTWIWRSGEPFKTRAVMNAVCTRVHKTDHQARHMCRAGVGQAKSRYQGTEIIFISVELPGHSSFVPCTATTLSPGLTRPHSLACFNAFAMTESVPTKDAVSIGMTPRLRLR